MSKEEFDKKSAIISTLFKELLDDGHSVTLMVGSTNTISTFENFKRCLIATFKSFVLLFKPSTKCVVGKNSNFIIRAQYDKNNPVSLVFKYEEN